MSSLFCSLRWALYTLKFSGQPWENVFLVDKQAENSKVPAQLGMAFIPKAQVLLKITFPQECKLVWGYTLGTWTWFRESLCHIPVYLITLIIHVYLFTCPGHQSICSEHGKEHPGGVELLY